ncbi:RNA-directed DNA polymerase [Ereboglobus sp. PH5-5]|uniref:RNA-directed DNA polymerase n=1 Tax=unclassified Ereboglobus TaxID=2626932 RepID=UPI002404CB8D|nr:MULTISPECIES: RNA-directed DNA polymerase [unclassified Ereboglobus]MDF9828599.1 RNA-directed DNA polymerase [Ereboglobus sp. PH5-10]MDF9834404.1 RNA-directed DNA polymerase [Ereboglobus sp. PH5-5]
MNTKPQRRTVIEMSWREARKFFLKAESYCNVDLPPYFDFKKILSETNRYLEANKLSNVLASKPCDHDDVNHTIVTNKDGKFAWRPFKLIHPALYVSMVREITSKDAWKLIRNRFELFSANPKIKSISIPVESLTRKKDKAEQILQWWQEIEQQSLELSLQYEYLAQTDLTDCYGCIYTHAIAWALHRQDEMKKKKNRNAKKFIGNVIDRHFQDMNYGQTNGIPQGSVLSDFISEIILGYADSILSEKLKNLSITEYMILRYRDDYRVFTNNPEQSLEILKAISETMYSLGMKLHPSKTGATNEVVRNSLKADKIEWIIRKQSDENLQKHLVLIHNFSTEHPNSGSLLRALDNFYVELQKTRNPKYNPIPLIALITDIAIHNPKTYAISSAILSNLIFTIKDKSTRVFILNNINNRFKRVPNTGHLQLWLQRISYFHGNKLIFSEPLCCLVKDAKTKIWNSDWISDLHFKKILSPANIINKRKLRQLNPKISSQEFRLFELFSL